MSNFHRNKILLISSLFILSSTVYADELFFDPIAYNDNNNTTLSELPSYLKSGLLNTVIVTGYGVNYEKALKNAFKNAVEQQIGVLVDSETLIRNDKIIKDDILTASNGFIKDYTQLSQSSKDGLVQVKIKAIVKSQEVEKKIKSLNISSFKIKDSSSIYAEIITKEKSKKDISLVLIKSLIKLLSRENYSNLIKLKLVGYKVLKNKVKNGKVEVEISYKINFNYELYNKKINTLENTLKNIGANVQNKTDYPQLSNNKLTTANRVDQFYSDKKDNNAIIIIKKNGRAYISNTWELPKNINVSEMRSYLKNNISIRNNIKNTINIELLDKKKNILAANIINTSFYRFYPMYNSNGREYFLERDIEESTYYFNHSIFAPFFSTKNKNAVMSESILKSIIKINIEDLRKISSATIQYQ